MEAEIGETARCVVRLPTTLSVWKEDAIMALYEMRTYTLYVGKMAEATKSPETSKT